MNRTYCTVLLLSGLFTSLAGQDTVLVMQYNLLYYGVNSSFCTSINNSISLKNEAMTKIVRHVSPDIIAVNEIGPQDFHHDLLLSASLELAYPGRYARAGFSNMNASSLVNDLYYDQHKFGLKARYGIYSAVRDADVYLLYLKSSAKTVDTTFIFHIVTHLKAGNTTSDQLSRAAQTADIMAWLSNQPFRGNMILSGDFNMKGSSEQAWYNLTQYPDETVRLYDPVNAPGTWSDNWSFRYLHTQSTRSSSTCGSGGGMDDRFDIILLSEALMEGDEGLVYLMDSYEAIGQDGLRLNQSITSPVNTVVPDSIAQALEDMSDHVPVTVKLVITDYTSRQKDEVIHPEIVVINGVDRSIGISTVWKEQKLDIAVFSIDGRLQWQGSLSFPFNEIVWLPVSFRTGAYVLQARGSKIANLKVLVF